MIRLTKCFTKGFIWNLASFPSLTTLFRKTEVKFTRKNLNKAYSFKHDFVDDDAYAIKANKPQPLRRQTCDQDVVSRDRN